MNISHKAVVSTLVTHYGDAQTVTLRGNQATFAKIKGTQRYAGFSLNTVTRSPILHATWSKVTSLRLGLGF